jgi:galactokinase
MTKHSADLLSEKFRERFGRFPSLFQAPGRVNLIGEHTDYNDGFVLPSAIDFCIRVAIAARGDRILTVHSGDFEETIEFSLDHLPAHRAGRWLDYVIGVATMLLEAGYNLSGANLFIEGNVPQGAGLSSSAALEVAVGYALLSVANLTIERNTLALLCQRAENLFVGARCGIMDQFVSCYGKAGCALLLDCRSREFHHLRLPENVRIVICNTMVRHSVASGEYNKRRAECEEGVRILRRYLPRICALRDVTTANLESYGRELPLPILRRCRHVVSENARVLDAAAALDHCDLEAFGVLMKQSHQSLRDDFEVSCPELDLMVDLAVPLDGVVGGRMTGGGFGGCTVNLVHDENVEAFKYEVSSSYHHAMGLRPEIYVCGAADGARETAD